MSYTSIEDLRTSTPDQFWAWWLRTSPYVRPGDEKRDTDLHLLLQRIKENRLYLGGK